MINFAKLFIRCEKNVQRNLVDYYNEHCIKHVKKSRRYKMKYTDNWCAMFTSVIANMCGKLPNDFPYEVSVLEQVKIARNLGIFYTDVSNAKCGDLIVFNWDGDWVEDHVGFVEKIGTQLHTIEGNKAGTVSRRVIDLHSRLIVGFIRT